MQSISIVIPAFNEEENISNISNELILILNKTSFNYEIIFVNDGSIDSSEQVLDNLNKNNPKVKYISFSRNFGHQAALQAGLSYASGDAVITMDCDLQHPPELIPEMIEKWKLGYKVVNAIRKYPPKTSIFKRMSSYYYYKLFNRLTNLSMIPGAADYKLYDKIVVEKLNALKENARFIRGLSIWIGFDQTNVFYTAKDRASGETKYSFTKMIHLALDGITSFSNFPLRIAVYFGFIICFFSFFYLVYVLYIRLFTSSAIPGWASMITLILFLGGVQLMTIGVVGIYIGKIFEEVKNRPLYIIDKVKLDSKKDK
ncbi:MAG: glycosyltransferase family 2 protein [Bacteroidota bacterium]|nr:glycosyltransferase family 2 protein [bacterium]MBU1875453.1 glycosyltransferase family 2 protein [bacterium]